MSRLCSFVMSTHNVHDDNRDLRAVDNADIGLIIRRQRRHVVTDVAIQCMLCWLSFLDLLAAQPSCAARCARNSNLQVVNYFFIGWLLRRFPFPRRNKSPAARQSELCPLPLFRAPHLTPTYHHIPPPASRLLYNTYSSCIAARPFPVSFTSSSPRS